MPLGKAIAQYNGGVFEGACRARGFAVFAGFCQAAANSEANKHKGACAKPPHCTPKRTSNFRNYGLWNPVVLAILLSPTHKVCVPLQVGRG